MKLAECAACGRSLAHRTTFQFPSSHGLVVKCAGCALRHQAMLRQSVRVALVVGTILIAINHGDAVLHGEWSRALAWKIPLTYLVPFSVATYAALANIRRGAVAVAASIHISPDPLRRRRISIP